MPDATVVDLCERKVSSNIKTLAAANDEVPSLPKLAFVTKITDF